MNAPTLSAPGPGARELGLLLSVAVRVEPTLIRAVRLHLAPTCDVGTEADLWFSDWVGTRGVDAVSFRPSIRRTLQARLSMRLAAADATDPAWRLWPIIAAVHHQISPALALEERVTWLSVLVAAGAATKDQVDAALRPALRAVVTDGRRGVSDWFAAARGRLPDVARRTVTAWQLEQTTSPPHPAADALRPGRLELPDVAALAPVLLDVSLSVRRAGPRLMFNPDDPAGAEIIRVPDTDPVVLELTSSTGSANTRTLQLSRDIATTVEVGSGPYACGPDAEPSTSCRRPMPRRRPGHSRPVDRLDHHQISST